MGHESELFRGDSDLCPPTQPRTRGFLCTLPPVSPSGNTGAIRFWRPQTVCDGVWLKWTHGWITHTSTQPLHPESGRKSALLAESAQGPGLSSGFPPLVHRWVGEPLLLLGGRCGRARLVYGQVQSWRSEKTLILRRPELAGLLFRQGMSQDSLQKELSPLRPETTPLAEAWFPNSFYQVQP